jgi:hypothetical protein
VGITYTLLGGGRYSCELAPSCISSSSSQRRFLVLFTSAGVTSGEESDGITSGVEDVVGSGEGWVSCTDEGCMSTEGEAAGPRHRRGLGSILVYVNGAGRRHEMIIS